MDFGSSSESIYLSFRQFIYAPFAWKLNEWENKQNVNRYQSVPIEMKYVHSLVVRSRG